MAGMVAMKKQKTDTNNYLIQMINVCLWILNRNKVSNPKFRSREKEILFIDARNLGEMVDRKHRELSSDDIKNIADTYHNYRNLSGDYEDVKGFCKVARIDEVKENDYILTPGRYVGIEEIDYFEGADLGKNAFGLCLGLGNGSRIGIRSAGGLLGLLGTSRKYGKCQNKCK